MPKIDGMDLLRAALRDDPARPVLMMTAHGTVDSAVEALKTRRLRLHHQALRAR
jgi:two-component system response regulator AtoC